MIYLVLKVAYDLVVGERGGVVLMVWFVVGVFALGCLVLAGGLVVVKFSSGLLLEVPGVMPGNSTRVASLSSSWKDV